MSLPEPIPKDGNVPMSWLIFVGRKRSPKHRLRTQNREKILRNGSRSQGFGLPFPGQVQSGVGIDRHFFERTVLLVPIHVIGGGTCQICTSCFGSLNGSGRSSAALTTLKIAVLAPMPRVNVSTATAANPGDLQIMRSA